MFSILGNIVLGCAFLIILLAWISGSKAARLLYGGSAERLNRKTRKQMVWAAYITLPSLAFIITTFVIIQSMTPVFWEDRVLLHLPLTVIPLLTIWLLAMPRLWKLWRQTHKSNGPLSPELRRKAAHPLIIVPFQMLALGGVTLFYFLLVTPVPLQLSSAVIPILIWLAATAAVWVVHDRRWKKLSRLDTVVVYQPWRRRLRALGIFCVAAGLAGVAMFIESQNSKLPAIMNMAEGEMDFGGGTELAHDAQGGLSVAMLTGPREGTPDRKFTLTAEKKTVTLSSGKTVDAWTYNGQLPGPELRMKQGELVEVTLINRDIEEGATIHWHGLNVPNAEDGVAGVTQDAVLPGEKHVYQFIAEQTGTFWYHSHQESQEAVSKGMFGPLIVEPAAAPVDTDPVEDITAMTHVWDGAGFAIGSYDTLQRKKVTPGTPVRLRLIHTQDWVRQKYVLTGTTFQVAAIDGTELNKPEDLRNTHVILSTGGRADLTFIMPDHPVYLSVGDNNKLGILLSRDGTGEIPDVPKTELFEPISYGTPAKTPVDANSDFDREFEMILDNKMSFYDGQFNSLYTINGKVFPDTPMFMVQEGDLVKTTIVNRGAVDHPMHLHGHHMLVLSHNGVASTGSPWWSDTLDVVPGDTYEVAFVANNPGLWMDHCHNLTHAADGMSMHLMYEGITTPYTVGSDTVNHPE